jgi:proteasome assembly chaperone (PAC2) family protein
MTGPLKLSGQPELVRPTLVVSWTMDASRLGTRVADYLNRKLGGQSFGEIEPHEFFTLEGVAIEDNLIQFPESRFYACPKHNLVIFQSTPPAYDWFRFLNLILDVAEHQYQAREMYIVGGMVSLGAHTAPRELMGTFNSPQLKEELSGYDFMGSWDYETPPGQRPTLNSFLLWAAQRRNIPAVTLWVPIPFYLVAVDDPRAQQRVLEFLDQRLSLHLDFSDLDDQIKRQNKRLAEARHRFPEIDESIKRLESNLTLTAEESQKLVRDIEKLLTEEEN